MIKKLILMMGLAILVSCGIKGPPLPPLSEPSPEPQVATPSTPDQTKAPVKKTKEKK